MFRSHQPKHETREGQADGRPVPGNRILYSAVAAFGVLVGTSALAQFDSTPNFFFHQFFLPPGAVVANEELFGSSFGVGDFNNDGYNDLAVGEPGSDDDADNGGLVHVFFSSGPSRSFAAPVQFGPGVLTPEGRFGSSLAAGDFNGDGIDDLAVGAPAHDLFAAPEAGRVVIFHGGTGGFAGTGQEILHPDLKAGANFGTALAALPGGLAVGAPGETVEVESVDQNEAGAVYLYVASTGGLILDIGFTQAFLGADVEAGDRFGEVLAAADFNGDGQIDLAIGVPMEDVGATVNAGAVSILSFPAKRGPSFGFTFTQADLGFLSEAQDQFGAALAAGDFDGDGRDDLAIGAPFENLTGGLTDAGFVHVVPGHASTVLDLLADQSWAQADTGLAANESDDWYGAALVAADFDGDGRADLATGAPAETLDTVGFAGAVLVVPGGASGVQVTQATLWTQDDLGLSDSVGALFGAALGAGDFDGSGAADLAIGAPAQSVGATADGAMVVLFSSPLFVDGFESGNLSAWSSSAP